MPIPIRAAREIERRAQRLRRRVGRAPHPEYLLPPPLIINTRLAIIIVVANRANFFPFFFKRRRSAPPFATLQCPSNESQEEEELK